MKKFSLILIVIFLSGCAGLPFPKITTPKKPDTVYSWVETHRVTPKAVVYDGKTVIVEETEKTLQVGLKVTPKQLTFVQRIANRIFGLSLISAIILAIGLFVAPGATITILLWIKRRWKRAMKETVSAIRESKAVVKGNGLYSSLNTKQSSTTKKIVGNIKADL